MDICLGACEVSHTTWAEWQRAWESGCVRRRMLDFHGFGEPGFEINGYLSGIILGESYHMSCLAESPGIWLCKKGNIGFHRIYEIFGEPGGFCTICAISFWVQEILNRIRNPQNSAGMLRDSWQSGIIGWTIKEESRLPQIMSESIGWAWIPWDSWRLAWSPGDLHTLLWSSMDGWSLALIPKDMLESMKHTWLLVEFGKMLSKDNL